VPCFNFFQRTFGWAEKNEIIFLIEMANSTSSAAFEGSFFAVSFALSIIAVMSIKYYMSSTFHAAAMFPRVTTTLLCVLSLYMGISLIVACCEHFNSTQLLYSLIRNREGYVNGSIFVLFGPLYLLPPHEVVEHVYENFKSEIKVAKRGLALKLLTKIFVVYLIFIQGVY
jgi:hypothetical protein